MVINFVWQDLFTDIKIFVLVIFAIFRIIGGFLFQKHILFNLLKILYFVYILKPYQISQWMINNKLLLSHKSLNTNKRFWFSKTKIFGSLFLKWWKLDSFHWFFIPHATSCGGYNVFDPYVRPFVRQSVRLSVRPSFSQSVRPSVIPSVRPSVRLSVRPSVSQSCFSC